MTTTKINERYELKNMPISDKTRDGIAKGNLLDALQTLLRAMGMLEFNLEEVVVQINDKLERIETRLASIELRLGNVETQMERLRAKDKSLEEQIIEVKQQLAELELA